MGLTPRAVVLAIGDGADEPLLRAVLASKGYGLASTDSAASARDWLKRHRADLVIVDQSLPDENGVSLAEELQRGPDGAPLRVALLSPAGRAALDELPCDALLAKPLNFAGLITVVDRLLGDPNPS